MHLESEDMDNDCIIWNEFEFSNMERDRNEQSLFKLWLGIHSIQRNGKYKSGKRLFCAPFPKSR